MMTEQSLDISELENLRNRIHNEDYLYEAIQRIAQVLSNELLDINGGNREQRQKGR